jgi:hypothetical protein
VLACLLGAQRLAAQTPAADPRPLDQRLALFEIPRVLAAVQKAASPAAPVLDRDSLIDVLGSHADALISYALPPRVVRDSVIEFLQSAEKGRVDLQTGSSPSAGGSTSAAARTGIATLIGFALESGSLSQTVDQNVATFRANADGLLRFLSNQEVFPVCAPQDPQCSAPGIFKDLELSASFNVSDAGAKTLSGTMPGATRAVDLSANVTRHQFASATARYALLNPRDPRSKEYRQKWTAWFRSNQRALETSGRELLDSVTQVTVAIKQVDDQRQPATLTNQSQYNMWRDQTRAALAAAPKTEQAWEEAYARRLDDLLARMRRLDPDFDRKLADAATSYLRFAGLRRDLESTFVLDPALTLEYTYAEPPLQPKLHTVRVAYARSPKGTPGHVNTGTITLNAGLDFYADPQATETPLNTSRWKDAQVALQFDRPLGPAASSTQFSLGAYYQYQMHPNLFSLPAGATTIPGTGIALPPEGTQLLTQAGSIAAVQATLTLRLGASGIKVPIGISWSNRTELVSGNEVRGHVGFTFDSSPLLLIPGFK